MKANAPLLPPHHRRPHQPALPLPDASACKGDVEPSDQPPAPKAAPAAPAPAAVVAVAAPADPSGAAAASAFAAGAAAAAAAAKGAAGAVDFPPLSAMLNTWDFEPVAEAKMTEEGWGYYR